jgi:hypothetical protein
MKSIGTSFEEWEHDGCNRRPWTLEVGLGCRGLTLSLYLRKISVRRKISFWQNLSKKIKLFDGVMFRSFSNFAPENNAPRGESNFSSVY